uniref:GMC family oxidoreductase n=1 Tax=Marinobacterium profundum TaxID=1714300 RepID=UPI00082B5304|nr:GMC family oxidoreductase N-terminal domain-containing protein [Marinobacterium profundum]
METQYDYVVIGGGSAGCVAAARLARESGGSVLLLEAGHSHRHLLLDMPPGIFKMINGSKFMRYHQTVPQQQLGGRVLDIPQGNVLGGGSSVNAQVYMRGRPSDYDAWDQVLGTDAGWAWKDVLPYFRRMEGNNRLSNDLHGIDGPLLVSDPKHVDDVSRWFVQSVQALGEPYNDDFNGPAQRGCGFYQFTNRNGKRSSSAYAYLGPLADCSALTVRVGATVQKIELSGGVAIAVQYRDAKGELHRISVGREVVVAAGALVSPQLLMLSGIGPGKHLREMGIDCHVNLAGVGENLIDHPEVPIIATANGPYGYFKQGVGWRMLRNGLQFKLFGSGPVTSAGVEAGAFVNPLEREAEPTIQAFCVPIVYLDRDLKNSVEDTYGMTVTTVVVKPKSRGYVRLRSANPDDMPQVCPNLLGDDEDMQAMVAGQRFFLKAFQTGPLAARVKRIIAPAPDDLSDDALVAHCKRFVKTNYHPAGTCRMGRDDDPLAVLDNKMRVLGVSNLRVCDMSAVPDINAGNTNAPAMMLGDRCADFMLDESGRIECRVFNPKQEARAAL